MSIVDRESLRYSNWLSMNFLAQICTQCHWCDMYDLYNYLFIMTMYDLYNYLFIMTNVVYSPV